MAGYFSIQPVLERWDRAEQEEQKLKKAFEDKAFVANIGEYKLQMLEMEQSFESILKQLPRDTDMSGYYDISLAALITSELRVISPFSS